MNVVNPNIPHFQRMHGPVASCLVRRKQVSGQAVVGGIGHLKGRVEISVRRNPQNRPEGLLFHREHLGRTVRQQSRFEEISPVKRRLFESGATCLQDGAFLRRIFHMLLGDIHLMLTDKGRIIGIRVIDQPNTHLAHTFAEHTHELLIDAFVGIDPIYPVAHLPALPIGLEGNCICCGIQARIFTNNGRTLAP